MKKQLIFLFAGLLFLLSGCTFSRELSVQYSDLLVQYHTYLENDISDEQVFRYFINDVTQVTTKSNVMIRVESYDTNNILNQVSHGSGSIFFGTDAYQYLITSYSLVHASEHDIYTVYDYQGRTHIGYLFMESEKDNLSVLRFLTDSQYVLPSISVGSMLPIQGEPIVLIGYVNQVMNALSMGTMKASTIPNIDNTVFFDTSIPSDIYGNGGAIINTNLELIGIQILTQNGYAFAVSIESILNTIELFYDQQIF